MRSYPLRYDPAYWNLVFPLGGVRRRHVPAADYTPLQSVSHVMIRVALAAWLATMAGLLRSLRGGGATAAPAIVP